MDNNVIRGKDLIDNTLDTSTFNAMDMNSLKSIAAYLKLEKPGAKKSTLLERIHAEVARLQEPARNIINEATSEGEDSEGDRDLGEDEDQQFDDNDFDEYLSEHDDGILCDDQGEIENQ